MEEKSLSDPTRKVAHAKKMLASAIPGSLAAASAAYQLERAEMELQRTERSKAATATAAPPHIHIHELKGIKMNPTEKSRLASILCAPLALKYPDFAQHLAFQTELSLEQSLEILAIADRGATAKADAPRASAAPNRLTVIKDDAAGASPRDLAASWVDVASKLNAEAQVHNPRFVAPNF